MDVVGGLQAAKVALGIVKNLREIDRSVDEATFKLKLAGALADTKLALSDAKVKVAKLEDEIAQALDGSLCPVCRNGRLKVVRVRPNQMTHENETHDFECNSIDCNYKSSKTYLTGPGRYKGLS